MVTEINGSQRLLTKSELILKNAQTLKNILSKDATEEASELKIIPYRLNSMRNKNIVRNIILQNNEFLRNMVIVPIFGVKPDEEDNVFAIVSDVESISGMEKT